MVHVGKVEAGSQLASLVDRVEAGEEVVLTRDGREVARIVSATRRPPGDVRATIERIQALSEEIADSPVRISIRELRDEGRM
jgi:prevent-host-death family protein